MMNALWTKSMFTVLILLMIGRIQVVSTQNCGPNEKPTNCTPPTSCQPSCDSPDGTICALYCSNACVCQDGFIRNSENNMACINETQCNKTQTASPPSCGPNEVPADCASLQSCQPSCDNPNGTICPRICAPNSCVCNKGFIRDSQNNMTCVNKTECNTSTIGSSPNCGPNEMPTNCTPPVSCQPSCDNPNGTICPLYCSNACVCQDGFIRDPQNNLTCIEKTECENGNMTRINVTCNVNEKPDPCANPCQPSCIEPNRKPCETLGCSTGCVCYNGYLRATNDTNSSCIKCNIIN